MRLAVGLQQHVTNVTQSCRVVLHVKGLLLTILEQLLLWPNTFARRFCRPACSHSMAHTYWSSAATVVCPRSAANLATRGSVGDLVHARNNFYFRMVE